MPIANIDMLQIVANGLGELRNEVVFVGGAVAELYADNPAASDIRPTTDVDFVVELSSRSKHAKLEEDIRAKGFKNDTSKGAPICRYIYQGIKVDVMPSDSKILGFSNIWYLEGIKNKISEELPDETEIFIFTPVYYLAAKLEAHKNRGGNDLRQSKDFEDIIYLLDNCSDLLEQIMIADSGVQQYLKNEFSVLLKSENIIEGIECALPRDDSSADYVEIIIEIMQSIVDIV